MFIFSHIQCFVSASDTHAPGEFDSVLPKITNGRMICKRGGAGIECLNVENIGIVVKCADGNMQVISLMMLRCLEKLKLLSEKGMKRGRTKKIF